MPRSVVYRSFVTCDDPKGVVECKTVARSKHKTTTHSTGANDVVVKYKNEEMEKKIMEVSRGAEKLNEVVGSWSNKHRAKNIARDLLQGALHLQDSLLVLTKLQQSSTMQVRPFSLPSARHQGKKDGYDELREVIRESFIRQKILPGKEPEDLPSSSSSRSANSSLICSSSQHETTKSPNLIAKLMGLDGFKEKEKEKFSSLVDIRDKKKPQRTVEGMVETMQFLGRQKDESRASLPLYNPPIVIMKPRRRENHSIIEEKKIITTSLVPQNVGEVQAPRRPSKKLDENKLSRANTKDRAKMNHSKPPVPRQTKKESVIRRIDDVKPKKESFVRGIDDVKPKKESFVRKIDDFKPKVAPSIRTPKDAKCQVYGRSKNQDVGRKNSTFKRESCASKGQIGARNESIKRASIESSKAKPKMKLSPSLVENVPIDVNIESNIEELLVKEIGEEVIINPCEKVSISEPITNDDVSANEDETRVPSNTRRLLLSSVSFLTHVEEELFDIGTCVMRDSSKEVVDDPLLLDCAKELLRRKRGSSTTFARIDSPSSLTILDDKSIQDLVGEISDGIEFLRSYSKCCGDVVHVDRFHPMLERDLWWNEEVTGAWDLGWRKDGYTMEAMKEVVHDIERLVLSEVLDDLVVQLMGQL